MTVIMIGEEDSAVAFNLIGIESYTAESFDQFKSLIEKSIKNPDIDLIIINEKTYFEHEEYLLKIKQTTNHPTIVEVEDILGSTGPSPIDEILKKYVGIK